MILTEDKQTERQNIDTIDRSHKNIPRERVLQLARKGVAQKDIAELTGCSKQNISQMLKRYGEDKEDLKRYKNNEANIYSYHKAKILSLIDYDKISIDDARGLKDAAIALGIIDDKEQRKRGLATTIFSRVDYQSELKEVQKLQEEIEMLENRDTGTFEPSTSQDPGGEL